MFPDEKMNTEEAANKADAVLDSIGNNLKKFLEADAGSNQIGKSGLYAPSGSATTIVDKRKQFAENLALVNEGRQELHKEMQQSIERKLVSPVQSR